LWGAFLAGHAHPILHHAGLQEAPDDAKEAFVADAAREARHQDVVIDPIEGNHHTLPIISTSRNG